MNQEENDKDPNHVSNQDMREYKSADQGVEDSGGLTSVKPTVTDSDPPSAESRSGDSGGSAVENENGS